MLCLENAILVFIYLTQYLISLQSELEIEPRYPLFGGWKATFVIGYGLPLQDFLFESPDGRRYLNFTFGCPLVETVVDKLTIKVSLHSYCYNLISPYLLLQLCSQIFCHIHILIEEMLNFRWCFQRDQKTHLLSFLFQWIKVWK